MKKSETKKHETAKTMKALTLDDFTASYGTFKTEYGSHDDTKYTFEGYGWRIHIYQLFGKMPWAATVTHPDGYVGECSFKATAQEALDYVLAELF